MNAHAHHLTRDQVIALLEERDVLREAVRQLQAALAPMAALPRAWRLTGREEVLLRALHAVGPNVLHRERAMLALYGMFEDDTPEAKILDVFICKIRRKLMEAQTRIGIETVWGRGWRLDAKSHDRLSALIETETAGVAAAQTARLVIHGG